ncbi:juvenile hormone acid O-methyltransferase isoform X2 [Manduca sexta]|nr:juvenile hormone acid O-methyltransferase isoform X2 [Manduca sexta]
MADDWEVRRQNIKIKTLNIHMEDNPELFNKYNNVTKRDTAESLKEYAKKIKWRSNARVLDIGSADGSVTSILSTYIPQDYEILLGCDINSNSVKFANAQYGTERMKFFVLDIEKPIPEHLKESFDHVFSFYTLHWLTDPVMGYINIYHLLKPGGECFLVLSGKSPFYDIYHALSLTEKWAPWAKYFDTIVSPYHDCKDPDNIIFKSLKNIGFHHIDVRCKQKVFVYENTDVLKSKIFYILFDVSNCTRVKNLSISKSPRNAIQRKKPFLFHLQKS